MGHQGQEWIDRLSPELSGQRAIPTSRQTSTRWPPRLSDRNTLSRKVILSNSK
jgi:hypothetical protein